MVFVKIVLLISALLFGGMEMSQTGKPTPTPEPLNGVGEGLPSLQPFYGDESGASLEGDWEAAVADLEREGLIDDEGELLFSEDYVQEVLGTSGDGTSRETNVVMGALMSVRENHPNVVGACLFITRGVSNARGIIQGVGALFNSDAEIALLEQVSGNTEPRLETFDYESESGFYNPVYVLVLVRNQTLSVWVDGEPVIEFWELEEDVPNRYAESVLTTVNPERGCVMTHVWAYAF